MLKFAIQEATSKMWLTLDGLDSKIIFVNDLLNAHLFMSLKDMEMFINSHKLDESEYVLFGFTDDYQMIILKEFRTKRKYSFFPFIIANGFTSDFFWTGKWFQYVEVTEQKIKERDACFDDGWTYQWYWNNWKESWKFLKINKPSGTPDKKYTNKKNIQMIPSKVINELNEDDANVILAVFTNATEIKSLEKNKYRVHLEGTGNYSCSLIVLMEENKITKITLSNAYSRDN